MATFAGFVCPERWGAGIVGTAFLYLNWFVCVAALIAYAAMTTALDAVNQEWA
jgi:hypothetical protein